MFFVFKSLNLSENFADGEIYENKNNLFRNHFIRQFCFCFCTESRAKPNQFCTRQIERDFKRNAFKQ